MINLNPSRKWMQNVIVNSIVPVYGKCCGRKMESEDNKLVCLVCSKIDIELECSGTLESQKAQFNKSGRVVPGANTTKTEEEKITTLYNEFREKIIKNDVIPQPELLRGAAEMMFKFSHDNTKKSDNRDQLFATCMYYVGINKGMIIPNRELKTMLNLRKLGIGKGEKIIANYATTYDLNFELDPPIGELKVRYFLGKIVYETELLTDENVEFCMKVVNTMIDFNIGYNINIDAKCSGAVYYLLKFKKICDTYIRKKSLTEMLGLKQNTYVKAYKMIIDAELNAFLPIECQMLKEQPIAQPIG
jgi:hypothetical protein